MPEATQTEVAKPKREIGTFDQLYDLVQQPGKVKVIVTSEATHFMLLDELNRRGNRSIKTTKYDVASRAKQAEDRMDGVALGVYDRIPICLAAAYDFEEHVIGIFRVPSGPPLTK